jgi:isopentenyl-diphosphate delta-isomerase
MPDTIDQRKRDHLEAFRQGSVNAERATTWLECVHLTHEALPELNWSEIDLTCEFAGHGFDAPLFITGMTGGTQEASMINQSLARVACKLGIGLGLGSGRAALERADLLASYDVRKAAGRAFVAWNLGGVQLVKTDLNELLDQMEQLRVDALCIHLNPAQELFQPEGDRDFRGVLAAIEKLVVCLTKPLIVKETGCGLGREAGLKLKDAGVSNLDVAGCGGTSWVGVELLRRGRQDDPQQNAFWDWGIPTAAALVDLADCGLDLMASGGIRTGLDVARSLALGAKMAGLAAPVLRAYFENGEQAVESLLENVLTGLRRCMLLTGCGTVKDLAHVPRFIDGPLRHWLAGAGT